MEQIDLNKDIDAAVRVLDEGGVILYPTDTVWGIGCDACNPAAVEKVYRIKNRPDSKALITLVGSVDDLQRWVESVPPAAVDMISGSERPVTVVFDKGRGLAPNLLAADGLLSRPRQMSRVSRRRRSMPKYPPRYSRWLTMWPATAAMTLSRVSRRRS